LAPLLIIASCQPPPEEHSIPVELQFNGKAIGCAQSVDDIFLTDFRMYVSDIRIAGKEASFSEKDIWHQRDIALLDLEDGVDNCREGTPRSNGRLLINVSANSGPGLSFVIGVPETENHQNPIEARPPLGFTDMHWHWRSGYKFLRTGVRSPEGSSWVHIGSNRCEGTIARIEGCRNSNRARVSLPEFVVGQHGIVIDIAALFRDVSLTTPATTCSSGPTEDTCGALFAPLGLEFETGESLGPSTLFSQKSLP
jgi:uncharacterized repeat protein (TIGR04052 family)